jgi:hypothetical protein
MVCNGTENQNQGDIYPFVQQEISVLHESPLGHLRCCLTDVPPQPNSPSDNVIDVGPPRLSQRAGRGVARHKDASQVSASARRVEQEKRGICLHRHTLLPTRTAARHARTGRISYTIK